MTSRTWSARASSFGPVPDPSVARDACANSLTQRADLAETGKSQLLCVSRRIAENRWFFGGFTSGAEGVHVVSFILRHCVRPKTQRMWPKLSNRIGFGPLSQRMLVTYMSSTRGPLGDEREP
jgi:hypothetical protein